MDPKILPSQVDARKLYPAAVSIVIGLLGGIGLLYRVAPGLNIATTPDSLESWRLVSYILSGEYWSSVSVQYLAKILGSTGLGLETAVSLLPPLLWLLGLPSAILAGYLASKRSLSGSLITLILYALAPSIYAVTVGGRLLDGTVVTVGSMLLASAIAAGALGRGMTLQLAMLLGFLGGAILPSNGYSLPAYAALLVFAMLAPTFRVQPRAALAITLSTLIGALISGSPWVSGITFDFVLLLGSTAAAISAVLLQGRGITPFWVGLGGALLAAIALLSGLAIAPPEVLYTLNLAPPTSDIVVASSIAGSSSLSGFIREAIVWWALLIVGSGWLAYRTFFAAKLGGEDLVAYTALSGLVASISLSTLNTEVAPAALVFLGVASAYAINALKSSGLAEQSDELGRVVVLGLGVAIILSSGYLAYADYTVFSNYTPSPIAVSPGADTPWRVALERLSQVVDSNSTIIVSPYYAPLVESALGVDLPDVLDDNLPIFNYSRVLTASEGEANYILSEVLKAEKGNTYVIVYEGVFGAYDVANNVLLLHPRPTAQSLPDGTVFFMINGVYDMHNLFVLLKSSERVDEAVQSPFDTEWSSEFIGQGVITLMFPALTGEPGENVERARNTLLVKLFMDSVNNVGSSATELSGKCGFLPENVSTIFGVFVPTSTGGQIQPVFFLDEPYSFEPLVVSLTCLDILAETENRIEFYAEMVAVYTWVGSP